MDKFFSAKKQNLFLALKIEIDEVKSAIWSFEEGVINTLALGERKEWEDNKEELLVSSDASIASAVTRIKEGEGRSPTELILALPSDWVENNKIKSDRSSDLSFLVKKLSLNPLGFVVVPEAITYYLKHKEKDFASAILIYLGSKEITVSLIEDGKLIKSESVGKSDNLALDVEEGVLRFPIQNLPSRILLYNNEELEEARQTLISYPWQPPTDSGQPGFLHLPKVEILPKDFDIQAVVFAGGEELRKSQPEMKEVEIKEEKTEPIPSEFPEEESPPEIGAELVPEEPIVSEPEIEFVQGEDILKLVSARKIEPDFSTKETVEEEGSVLKTVSPESESKIIDQPEVKRKLVFPGPKNLFRGILNGFQSLIGKVGQLPFFKKSSVSPGKKLKIALGGIFLLVFSVVLAFYFFARAEIALMVEPTVVEKEFTFEVDSETDSVNSKDQIIPGKIISVEVSGSRSTESTGKKTVGDKAKGEVIIFNRTESVKAFPAGKILVGIGKLKFVLDDGVEIASKTPDLASGIDRWGEAKVSVTAEEIGGEYNLAANSQFNFEDLPTSSFLAKNSTALTGGTSRQITVVSKEDQDGLLEQLSGDLSSQAKEKLSQIIGEGESLIFDTLTSKIISKEYDHEPQDEVDSLTLDLKTQNSTLTYKNEDLNELLFTILASEKLAGMEVDKGRTEITVSSTKTEFVFTAEARVFLKQVIDPREIINQIKGKSLSSTEKTLLGIKTVRSTRIQIFPSFFQYFSRMPFNPKNLDLEVKIN